MLRLRLIGDFSIEVDGRPVEMPTSRRARSLLAWLALERRMHARTGLAARFWPDVLDESARTSLRSALSALRRSLGADSERYLIATRDEVGLAGEDAVWTDIAELHRLVAEGRLEEALELCAGELLIGLDDDWVFERRDEHRELVARVLGRLAARAESEDDLPGAIVFTRRQAALDPLAEEPQRDLMRRLAAAGDRAAALRTYERLSQRLRESLRIMPSHATRELAEALRQGRERSGPDADPGVLVRPAGAEAPETRASEGAPEAPAPAVGVVTLLFTDLVGSTELLGALGDDEAERLRRVHFGLLRDVAVAHSGEEVKNLGDGLMVAFPSAVNAVGCAIGIQQAVHRHNARQDDERLRVRVGLGIGEPIREEGDYFGTPVVVAKRLCDQAEGGQILATQLLRELVGSRGGFSFRSCGPLTLKGMSEPLAACEVCWEPSPERRVALPPAFAAAGTGGLVGRDAELDELGRSWQDARVGPRRVAMLVGEPGIGKTTLAAEFCRTAYAEGGTVLLGRCFEDSPIPYQPFVEALGHYVSETQVEELRLAVGPHRATLAKLLPGLALEPDAADGRSSTEDPERQQFVLFDAVTSLLGALADEHPLIVVLDDLHWADAPTLQLLRHLVRATEATPMLILGTYRGTEVDDEHPLAQALAEMRRARVLDSVFIGGFGEGDVSALIRARTGHPPPPGFARSIAERTEGNPLFVEEVLREIGAQDDWDAALAGLGVPEGIKDLLLRRLRRLGEDCSRLLAFAAVQGREFTIDVLERVAGVGAEEVAEQLEQAIAAQVIDESPGPVGRYTFAHALIRETIYEQLSRVRRAQLHRLIGEAIESASIDRRDLYAGELARHFSAAGDAAKAYRYHALAAAAAQQVYATEPALEHYTAAIAAAAEILLEADREPELRVLLLGRGRIRFRTGDDAGATADLEAALGAARRSGDRIVEMDALNELGILQLRFDLGAAASYHEAALEIAGELGDAAAQTNALDRLSVISSHLLELDRGLALGERALELARGTGDPNVIGRAKDSIKLAAWQLGDLDRLQELTAELEPLWRERSDLWYLQWTLLESAFVPIGAARWPEAAERLAEAVAVNRRLHDPVARTLILDGLCWLRRSSGAYEEALSAGRSAVELSTTVGWEGWTAATLGTLLLELAAPLPAAEVLERGLVTAEQTGTRHLLVRCSGQLAWARWLLGHEDDARSLAARAEDALRQASFPPGGAFLYGAHAYAAIARVHLAAGAPERGEALLRPVLEAAERSGWREVTATLELALGLCLVELEELDQAAALLGRAAETGDHDGIPAPAWEAHCALARLHRAAGRWTAAEEQAAIAKAIVDRITAGLKDEALRDALRDRVGRSCTR